LSQTTYLNYPNYDTDISVESKETLIDTSACDFYGQGYGV